MKVTITCECGNKEEAESKKVFGSNVDIFLKNFIIEGYEDEQGFVRCRKCDVIYNF